VTDTGEGVVGDQLAAESGLNPTSVAVFVSFPVWLDASRYDNGSRTPDKDIIVAITDLEDGGFGQQGGPRRFANRPDGSS
jgi:hypothetical protein